jgi:hypothetical protein
MARPITILHSSHCQIQLATADAREQAGQALESVVFGFVDPLAGLAAETPAPRAVRDEPELVAATIASVRSHRLARIGLVHVCFRDAR